MASARFLADITGPKGDKGEGVGNSLRIRPLSELPSLNVADWIGNDLIGIYPVANSSTALTIVGRPLGSDVAAFVALEPLASGGSLVKWVEYTGARRSFEKVISTTSANRTEWKRTDVTTRTVLHQLSMPGNNALVDTEPTRHVRLPLKTFAAVDSWELVFKNFNDISSTNRGAVDFVDVYIAKRASDGNGGYTQNFAEEPTKLGTPVRYSVGATSERYVITDIHFQLEANVEYLISYAYTTPGGTPNHMGIGGSYLGTLPIGVASMSVSNTWSPYTPLDVYIKLQAAPETPFYIYPGSSSETGLNTDYPLRDCWGWRHAEANGAIPALLGQSGTSLESWVGGSNYIRSKLSTIARADKVVGMPGSNDIYGGATLSQMQARLTAFALYVRRYMGQSFEVADVFPRRTETAAIKAVRQGFNDYLRTLPGGALVCHSRASAVEAEDGLMRPDFDSGDGVHLNTFGQHMLAAHIITGGGSGSGLPGPAGPTGAGVPTGGTAGQFIRKNSSGTTTEWVSPTAAIVGLGNVDNTTDAGKPLSTAAVNALAGKASTTDVALKADKTELATKADASALADKANVSDLALKADTSALTPLLPKTEAASTYATKTEVTTELEARVQPIVPPLVSQAIANDPTIVSSAANMAQSTAGLVPVWKANTGYTAGQRVIAPNGDVVSAKVAFTSAAAYSATNWNASTQDARVGTLEASQYIKGAMPTTANFNDYITPGKTPVPTSSGKTNCPFLFGGWLNVDVAGTTIFQHYDTSEPRPKQFERRGTVSGGVVTWAGWQSAGWLKGSIPSSADLNDYISEGAYEVANGGTANKPTSGVAKLEVNKVASTVVQEALTLDETMLLKVRRTVSGTFIPWQTINYYQGALVRGVSFDTLFEPSIVSVTFTDHPGQPLPKPGNLETVRSGVETHHYYRVNGVGQTILFRRYVDSLWQAWEDVTTGTGGGGTTPGTGGDYATPTRSAIGAWNPSLTATSAAQIVTEYTKDRTVGFNGNNSFGTLRETRNDGETWTDLFTFPRTATSGKPETYASFGSVTVLDNGELLCITQNDPDPREVWLSEGYGKGGAVTFSKVHVASSAYTYFAKGWSISTYKNMVFLAEYGPKSGPDWNGKQIPDGQNARYVVMSLDFGKTYKTVFDLNDYLINVQGRTTTANQHVHGVAWDPIWDRLWIAFGDNLGGQGSTGILYSDDLGRTIETAYFYSGNSTAQNPHQTVGIVPMPKCILLATDGFPNGVKRIDRAGGKHSGAYTIEQAYTINPGVETLTHLCQAIRKVDMEGGDGPVVFGFGAETSTSASHLVATRDGFTFTKLWEDSVKQAPGRGIRTIAGPNMRGELIVSSNDERQANLWSKWQGPLRIY